MNALLSIGKGRLTYLMAFVAVAWGAYGWWAGLLDQTSALTAIWGGFSVFGIRRAM